MKVTKYLAPEKEACLKGPQTSLWTSWKVWLEVVWLLENFFLVCFPFLQVSQTILSRGKVASPLTVFYFKSLCNALKFKWAKR
jgi:hypothetical protein